MCFSLSQVLLRFREAELQCTNNDMNELRGTLETADKVKLFPNQSFFDLEQTLEPVANKPFVS